MGPCTAMDEHAGSAQDGVCAHLVQLCEVGQDGVAHSLFIVQVPIHRKSGTIWGDHCHHAIKDRDDHCALDYKARAPSCTRYHATMADKRLHATIDCEKSMSAPANSAGNGRACPTDRSIGPSREPSLKPLERPSGPPERDLRIMLLRLVMNQ